MKHELEALRKFYELKKVYRMNSVEHRKESSAEHTWSCLILAEYVTSKMTLVRRKEYDLTHVQELLLYHDVVEIEAGDIPIHFEKERQGKEEKEMKAAVKLSKELPGRLGRRFLKLFKEFEAQKTPEAKFAKAIDKLDADIHELDYKRDWKGWSEDILWKHVGVHVVNVPEIKSLYDEMVRYAHKHKYFAEDGNV